ncbi:hypothetical protein GCM10010478_44520 [Streptomyces erythrogriseus]|uniref:Secreted protein n=3 Tax=Streptomyces TaxID=1883 RepID=A0ABN3X5V5_9ACTN|nr:hypothetical protein GCM10010265_27770 [Streptomyces griseoincarnatus]GGT43961.1 hypothetical protein GCM10010287_16570 [Streptomyces variabilis]
MEWLRCVATVMSTGTVMGTVVREAADGATSSACVPPSAPSAPVVREDPAVPGVPASVTAAPGAAEDAAGQGGGRGAVTSARRSWRC